LLLEVLKEFTATCVRPEAGAAEDPRGCRFDQVPRTRLVGDVFSHERRILNMDDEILTLKNRLAGDGRNSLSQTKPLSFGMR
jgi:hypothetical protein